MPLDYWAMATELCQMFKQKSLSKAIMIAIRKEYIASVLKKTK